MYKLVIEDDEGKTTVVPLIRDEITIGRKEGNTIRLTERNVSRRHARLVKSNGGIFIEDLGSYNGVKINGGKIQARTPIREGDRILIGDYQLWIQLDRAASAGPGTPKDVLDVAPTTAMPRQAPAPTAAMPAATKTPAVPGAGAAKHARLVILNSNLAGLDYPVEKAECVIGRTEDNDIVINHRSISRNHAKIVLEGETYKIVDLGSANGVRVNGEDYGKVELRKGDIIELGHVKIRFVPPGEPFVFDPRVDKLADAPAGGPPIAIIAVAAVAVIGLGVGGYLIFGGKSGDGSGTDKDRVTKTSAKGGGGGGAGGGGGDEGAGELAEVKKAIDSRDWAAALDKLDKSGATGPEADDLRKKAGKERDQKERYERFLAFLDDGSEVDAFNEGAAIDRTSVYWPDAEAKWTSVRTKLASAALAEARKAIEAGDATTAKKHIDEAKVYDKDSEEIPKVEDVLAKLDKRVAVAPTGDGDGDKAPPKTAAPKTARPDVPKTAKPATAAAVATAAPAEGDDAGKAASAKEEYTKGLRLFAASHEPEAMAAFKKAIKIDPKFPDPHRALGTIFARQGNLKGMCKEFKTYVRLSPHAGDTAKIKAEMAKYDTTVAECRSGD
jgi:pSer/pThr/pTyr-binding forkhead associated (FHA) protein/tetratricopeptide (TPR) repeat protein